MMKKYLFLLLFFIFLIPFSSGQLNQDDNEQTFGTFRQAQRIELTQLCSNCSYVNISSIIAPDSTVIHGQAAMTKTGTRYNYTITSGNTTQLGRYIVNGFGDLDGSVQVWSYDFLVTPSGRTNILGLFVIVIVLIYGVTLVGFFARNEWVTIFGGLLMIPLGLFTLINGIDIFRNFMTESISIVTIGLGSFFTIFTGISILEEYL